MQKLIYVVSFLCLVSSCDYLSWEIKSKNFTLELNKVSQIESRSAIVSGAFDNPKSQAVDEVGFVFGTSPLPTIDDLRLLGNDINSEVEGNLTGLEPDTKYHVRMYAVVEGSIYYSNERSFTTSKPTLTNVANNSCTNLANVVSYFKSANGSSAPWGIGSSGHSGSFWSAPDPNGSLTTCTGISYVEFERLFARDGVIRFWINTYNAGYANSPPEIIVNGVNIGEAIEIGGNTSSFYWMQVQTPVIPAGQNTIRLVFNAGSVYWEVGVDEIQFFEFE